ncbi:nucleotide sugar dehydrogenase, partial [Bdellovibrionota bacterium FG-2]
GFDIHGPRVEELKKNYDRNNDILKDELREASSHLILTNQPAELKQADFYIVAVPTPVNDAHQPDLSLVHKATETVGRALKKGDIVVYESTVYPGVTEEDCVPILERASGLKCGPDFKVGYSPERINPGDTEHTFTKIRKVVSGQDAESLAIISDVYSSVVTAGVFKAKSIKVAEAAKVIENTQRDLNIALMNELSLIFERLGIDTLDVLEAARTKWNFLPFSPGLVGGHCIGVDPYYLTYQAERFGYIPQVILAGRQVNDGMGRYVAQRMVKELIRAGHPMQDATVTLLGLTFKENCPDIRNTRAIDIANELKSFGVSVQIYDPLASAQEAEEEYGVKLTPWENLKPAEGVILAVAHKQFKELSPDMLKKLMKNAPVLADIKGVYDKNMIEKAGIKCWRL